MGYQVTQNIALRGKSGIEHLFRILANQDNGITKYTIAIDIIDAAERDAQLRAIFDFSNAAYDTGVRNRNLIAVSGLDNEALEFAQKQHITIIEAKTLEKLFESEPDNQNVVLQSEKIKTKNEITEALNSLGYKIEEAVTIQGRSGAEYFVDILAYGNQLLMAHSLGIEIVEDKVVDLTRISLFDTKAYDIGVDYKAIFAPGGLTSDAWQFAEHQQIRVLGSSPEPVGKNSSNKTLADTAEKEPVTPASKGKTKTAGEETQVKALRQLPEEDALLLIPEVMARRYNAIPLKIEGNTLHIAMANPADIFALEAFSANTHKRIKPIAATIEAIREAIDFNYKAYGEIEEQVSRISVSMESTEDRVAIREDAPLTQVLNLVIDEAAKAHASDIHVEPEENRLRIRYRIDGTLHDTMSLPLNIHRAIISRIKILGGMNISDPFRPQDGQFTFTSKGRQMDIRVATAPTIYGEMAALRILDKSAASRGLVELGMLPDILNKYQTMLKHPYGMILISGPTGAGKSTTLYASINSLDTTSEHVITIEDPAEYRIKDVNQLQLNIQAGITFASGLRAILRLDPDIILVGEIRDAETAGIATQAALTGHLMLSSIHANDSAGALLRMVDLGIEPFMLTSSVIGVVAQRMVRHICPDCRHIMEAPVTEQIAYEKVMGEKRTHFTYGTGCAACSFTGYRGRTGLFEVLVVNDKIRTLIAAQASKNDVRDQALENGMIPMIKDGMLKVKGGITTPSEVLRATFTQE